MKTKLLLVMALLPFSLLAKNEGKVYRDARGHATRFPLGDLSFADEVVSFKEGSPAARAASARKPEEALGPPNYNSKKRDQNFVTLGCGGSLTLRFTNNALVDVPGPDLYVFEVGPDIEATRLSISRDGKSWIDVGEISGGTAQVDIEKFVQPGDSFTYVRLTDLKSSCATGFPGADIDAVAAIGGALHISLKASVLFDTNESKLKPQARDELHNAAAQIRSMPDAPTDHTLFANAYSKRYLDRLSAQIK